MSEDSIMHVSLISDLDAILNLSKIKYIEYSKNKSACLEQDKSKIRRYGNRLRYPGDFKQRKEMRRDFSSLINYLEYPKDSRNEKDIIYRVLRSMFIYQYICRKNNILLHLEIENNKIDRKKDKISRLLIYKIIDMIKDELYIDKKNVFGKDLKNEYIIKGIKSILENETNIKYLKKVEQLIKEV